MSAQDRIAKQNAASRFAKLLSLGWDWFPAAVEAGLNFQPCRDLAWAYVYALCDPDTALPFYIGMSTTEERPAQHFSEARGRGDSPKIRAIRAIMATGQEPLAMCIADGLTKDWALLLEARIITALGDRLTNGEPLVKITETWAQDAAVALRAITPYRQWLRARPRSAHAREVYKVVVRGYRALVHAGETGIWIIPKG